MAKNCWEFKNCGRELGGAQVAELGVCLASTETRVDGMNSGNNGGRVCWAISGTLCGGEVQGTFANKCLGCVDCDFYELVGLEDGPNHESLKAILRMIS